LRWRRHFPRFVIVTARAAKKASGSAHAANAFAPAAQFKWIAGEALIKRYDHPAAKRFSVWFCTQCGTRATRFRTTAARRTDSGGKSRVS